MGQSEIHPYMEFFLNNAIRRLIRNLSKFISHDMSDSCLFHHSKSFNDFVAGAEYKKLYDSSETLECSGSDIGRPTSIYSDVLSITDELFPKLDESNESTSDDINLTLDKLNFISRWDEESAFVVNKVLRTRDMVLKQAPYTSLIKELYRTNNVNVGKNILSIFNSILSSPSIKSSMKEELWSLLNHVPNVKIFNEFKNPQTLSVLLDFLNLYLEQLRHESLLLIQPNNSFHSTLLDTLYQSVSKDENSSIHKDYWKNLSVLGVRFIIYYSQCYSETFKNILEKYPTKYFNSDKFLPNIINNIIKTTISSIEFCLDYLSSTNNNEESSTSKMYKTLISFPHAFYDICSISLVTYDKLSLINQSSDGFKQLRQKISSLIQEYYSIPMIKSSLLLDKMLNKPDNIDEKLLDKSLNCYSIKKDQTIEFFQELSYEITLEENKDELDYLSYVMQGLKEAISNPSFQHTYLTSKFISVILSNLTRQDSIWMRHKKLSIAISNFIEHILIVDMKGIKKFREALRYNAKGNAPNELYKPLIKMIRNNWTFNSSIKIVNILFAKKHSISGKKQFLQDLLASEALTFIKSKSWSTVSRSEELSIFQANILTYDKMPFEHINEDHVNLLINCWNVAFENMKITNCQIRKDQWMILGFSKFESLKDFSSITVKSLENLLHFAKKYTVLYRTLILYDGDIPVHVGDCGIMIFESIMKFAHNNVILPLLFDGSDETIGDMYAYMWLWVIQNWLLSDMEVDIKKIISKLDSFLVDALSKSKPSSLQEFYQILNIKREYFENIYENNDNQNQVKDTCPFSLLASTTKKLKMMITGDESCKISPPKNKSEELRIIDRYIQEHKDLFTLINDDTKNKEPIKKKKEYKKPYLRSNYNSNTLSILKDELNIPYNSKKLASIIGAPVENILEYIRTGDNEKEKDVLKRRKAELKEQKQMKNVLSRYKSLHKKIIE